SHHPSKFTPRPKTLPDWHQLVADKNIDVVDAEEMVRAAQKAGVKPLIGFNYMKNPTSQLARKIIERG
ncbi:yjhC domain protein, partial [Candidatus Erwinia dacicola]